MLIKQIAHLDQANAIVDQTRPWQAEQDQKRNNAIMAVWSEVFSERVADFGRRDYRPIFIAALPRSGTTLLEQVLD